MESQVDRSVWHALAGVTSIAPLLSSTVYYWPQGHVETYCGSAAVQALFAQFPEIKCGVLSMKFLADQATDEVFAHMILKPIPPGEVISQTSRSQITPSQIRSGCIKRLESYDLGRGSIKIQCFGVDTVFQQQDIDVSICDIHNRVWKFGHTYNKALKCHYLTDGWGEFVTTKKLLAGDALVFLKTIVGGVILGIRRAIPTSVSEGFYYKIEDRIQRNGKDLCSVEALGEALGKALRNIEFEVAYYPSACGSHFIHDSEEVEASRNVPWNLGMRVIKTSIEKDKLTRVCHHGIITSLSKNPLKWSRSSWKQMQVSWEDPQMEKSTNPWEIKEANFTVPTQKRRFITLLGKTIAVQEE